MISRFKAILANRSLRMQIVDELNSLKEKYGDDRRTEIITKTEEFTIEDMIAEEDMVITISHLVLLSDFPSLDIVAK